MRITKAAKLTAPKAPKAPKLKVSAGKHFEFTDAVHPFNTKVRQIRARRDIGGIKEGAVGGWITCEENLSDEAWVYEDAMVLDSSARVRENGIVTARAQISGNTVVEGYAVVTDDVHLEDCTVSGGARVAGVTFGKRSEFTDGAVVFGAGNLHIQDSTITGGTYLKANGFVRSNTRISGGYLSGRLELRGGAIEETAHVMSVGPLGSEGCTAILFRTLDAEGKADHMLKIGCWSGKVSELGQEIDQRSFREWEHNSEVVKSLWRVQYASLERMARATMSLWDRDTDRG